MKKIVASLLIVASLSGCANGQNPMMRSDGNVSKQNMGTVLGVIGGAALGSMIGGGKGRALAMAGGAVAGGLLGNNIGGSLDKADLAQVQQTSQTALETAPTGKPVAWNNPDTGNSGTVTPTRTFENASGEQCREYTQEINVGGKKESAYGKACRQPDGTWKIQS